MSLSDSWSCDLSGSCGVFVCFSLAGFGTGGGGSLGGGFEGSDWVLVSSDSFKAPRYVLVRLTVFGLEWCLTPRLRSFSSAL